MSTDEDKTRVLQRRAAKDAAPEAQGEKIVFLCPNGHRIIVAAANAGKRGKCSKCDSDVTIPRVGEAGRVAPATVAPAKAAPAKAEPAKGPPPAPTLAPPPPAPSVPDIQFQPPPEPIVEAPVSAEFADGGGDAEAGETWDFIGGRPEQPAAEGFEPAAWTAAEGTGGLATDGGNPTAILVGRLWAERQHGAVIELHLAGGSVILPEWYDANWSRGTHGLFASQAADGSVTLTAVAWETVQKIVVRQLTEVPNDMFT